MHKKLEILLTSVVGNIAEQYDFALYGYFTAIIAKLYFPITNQVNSLLLAFAVFATGFLTRPFGGIVFGYIGDRYGRKQALIVSIAVMTLPTTLIGLLPSYQTIGMLAPILLIVLRLFQGLAISGELIGSGIFLFESAHKTKQGFWGSLALVSTYLGFLLGAMIALLTSALLTKQQLLAFGWRIPFILALLWGIFATITRLKCAESNLFQRVLQAKQNLVKPIKTAITNHYPDILLIFMLNAVTGVAFFLVIGYFPAFFVSKLNFSLHQAMLVNSSLAFITVMVLILGWLSDKISRRLLCGIGILGIVFFAYPIFQLATFGTLSSALIAEFILMFFLAFPAASILTLTSEIIPITVRYSVMALGFNLGMTIFGGTAPLIAGLLVKYSHSNLTPAYYLIATALISLAALIIIQRKRPVIK